VVDLGTSVGGQWIECRGFGQCLGACRTVHAARRRQDKPPGHPPDGLPRPASPNPLIDIVGPVGVEVAQRIIAQRRQVKRPRRSRRRSDAWTSRTSLRIVSTSGMALGLGLLYHCGFPTPTPTPFPRLTRSAKTCATSQASDLRGFDAVVHLAALCNDPLGDLNANWTDDINHKGSVTLAAAARRAGVRRFVLSSSCSMYGAAGSEALTETATLNPLTAYARSKVDTERDLTTMATSTFSPVYLRNATVYGMSPRLRLDLVLNNLVAWAVTTGRVKVMSDGTPWRPIVHVQDICQAIELVLTAPTEVIHDQAFNIGTPAAIPGAHLADIVASVVPKCEVEFADGGGPDPRSYRVSFDKFAAAFPTYEPKWDAELGAREVYAACVAAHLTPAALVEAALHPAEEISRIAGTAMSWMELCAGVSHHWSWRRSRDSAVSAAAPATRTIARGLDEYTVCTVVPRLRR